MFSQTDRVVKVIGLSIDLGYVAGGSERLSNRAITDRGFVAPQNQVDDATFSSSRFTEDDNVWNGLLDYSVRLVIHDSEKQVVPECRFRVVCFR